MLELLKATLLAEDSVHFSDELLLLSVLGDADDSDRLEKLVLQEEELDECWLVEELVLQLLSDRLLSDKVDGLLPVCELDELVRLEGLDNDEGVLLDPATVLLLELLSVDAELQELWELALDNDLLDIRLDEILDSLHHWLVELGEIVDVDALLLDAELDVDWLLPDDGVDGVDQLLDSVDSNVLDEVRLDALLPDD